MAAGWLSAAAPVARRVRAYFAPVNRTTQTPVFFDPADEGCFNLDAPPAPWIDLGPIQGFTRIASSKSTSLMTGIPASTQEQVRESLDAQVSLQFLSWTKLTMALATGSQHMNLLRSRGASPPEGSQAQSLPAIAIPIGSTATFIPLASVDLGNFCAGSLVVVDGDYSGQTGYLGTPVSGAYLRRPLTDVDYIRRITFNVAMVSEVTSTGLILDAPLPGGAPSPGAKLQAVTGFADRLGGSFFHEWSALFVTEGCQGERIFFHYPRLQPAADSEEIPIPLAGNGKGSLERILLKAQFRALPVIDPLDGVRALCYRSFLPAPKASL